MATKSHTLIEETANSLIYLAEEPGYEKPVVMKVLRAEHPSPQRIIQFNNEYEFTSELNIPGVRKAYDSTRRDGRYILLLEYVRGTTLREAYVLRRRSITDCLNVAVAIADLLKEIHNEGIIHKDINPKNILVNDDTDDVFLIDFGISSRISFKKRHLGNPDRLEGSLAYISPEQTGRMNRWVDHRSDLYSLGVTLYEVLSGQLPFSATDSMELVHAHIAKVPVPLCVINPAIPKVLSDIVMQLMSKNADDRYQSAYGLREDLQRCLLQWVHTGSIESFELGESDFSGRFQLPQKFYGREAETAALMEAFERVAGGSLEMVLVSGPAGVGKSALINEVHKPITARRGYFIAGKFDQYQRNIPYYAISQAFNEYCNFILMESSTMLESIRKKIFNAVGQNGKVLTDVIPNLVHIIGEQPEPEKLETQEATNRFNLLFQKFLRVISNAEHPLVLFIDDLQWADLASLKLLQQLLNDEQNRYLLIIGAFRDNEVSEGHPLLNVLTDMEPQISARIALGALSEAQVKELVCDALSWTEDQAEELSAIIYQKTLGNAFFTMEFLKALADNKLFSYNFDAQCWQADIKSIAEQGITDNVVALMAGKIGQLPKPTIEILKLAACVGNTFDLRVLATIARKKMDYTLRTLWRAVEEGLVLPADEAYKRVPIADKNESINFEVPFHFLHDRVQQAAYSLIAEDNRKSTHLKIGYLRLKSAASTEEEVFDIVNHLNAGWQLIKEEAGRVELAGLNLLAGQRAKAASAFDTARACMEVARQLLPENAWEQHYSLCLDVYRLGAEAEYLTGQLDTSEQLLNTCLEKVRTPLEKADLYYLLMLRQAISSQYAEAIGTARKGLEQLDFQLPSENLETHIAEHMGKLVEWFTENGVESVYELPEMTASRQLAIIKILDNLSMPTYVSGQVNLWILHVLLKVRLSLEQGTTPETGYAFSEIGLIFCILGNYEMAFPCADLSKKLADKFEKQSLRHKSRSLHLIANYISPWRIHYRDTEALNDESYHCSLDSGELIFTGYTIFHPFYNRFFSGAMPLEALLEKTLPSQHFAKKIKHDLAYNSIAGMRLILLNLLDENSDERSFKDGELDEATFLASCTEGKDYYSIGTYLVVKAKVLYLYGCIAEAWETLESAEPMLPALSGNAAGTGTYHYTRALVAAALLNDATQEQQKDLQEALNSAAAQLELWAGNGAANFEHKHLLVKAEMARLANEESGAVRLYNMAAQSAQNAGYFHEEALAGELAARFFILKGSPTYARIHLREAYHLYLRWGAKHKARLLNETYPELMTQVAEGAYSLGINTTLTTWSTSGKELDFHSVVKASQTLAGEIDLKTLLSKTMDIVLENAGAQRAVLALFHEGHWRVEATAITSGETKLMLGIPLGEFEALPQSLVNYVLRTSEVVLEDNAGASIRFGKDPYIRNCAAYSVLALPLLHQSKKVGLLYLENNLSKGVFSPGQVEMLQLLSSQMAVSIKNAQLYNHLQDVNKAYERFVPLQFLSTLGKKSILDVSLGDQTAQQMSVMFSDIRSYTALAENMPPEDNFRFINGYLNRVGPCITSNGGFINQYYGDGLMALFPETASAVRAAVDMQKALGIYNQHRITKSRTPIRIGIGIHTGDLIMGIFGDEKRHNAGVISDVVNTASRLEGLTKIFGVSVLVSEDTLLGISKAYRYNYRYLGRVQVKGRKGIMKVYEFYDGDEKETAQLKSETSALFRQALEEYFEQQFAEAALHFKKVFSINPNDRVAEHYLHRAAHFLINATPPGWAGVEHMEEK